MSPFFPSSSLPCKRSPIGGSLSTSCLSVLSVSTGLSFCLSRSDPPPLLLPLASPGSGRGGQPLRCARLFASSESARHSGRTFGQASGRRRARALGRSLSGGALVVVSLLAPCPRRGLGGGCGVRGGVPRHEALQGHRKAGGEPCDLRAGCAGRVQARPWHFGALAPNPQSAQIHCK